MSQPIAKTFMRKSVSPYDDASNEVSHDQPFATRKRMGTAATSQRSRHGLRKTGNPAPEARLPGSKMPSATVPSVTKRKAKDPR